MNPTSPQDESVLPDSTEELETEVVETEETEETETTEVEPKETEDVEPTSEDKLAQSEAKVAKLEADNENYKKGLQAEKAKRKPKVLPPTQTEDGALTRKEFYQANEQDAIRKAKEKNPLLNEHWEEVISFYTARNGKVTSEGIQSDLEDALTLWKSRNPKVDSTSKSATAQASTSSASPAGGDTSQDSEVELTKDQKIVAQKLGMTASEYAKNLK